MVMGEIREQEKRERIELRITCVQLIYRNGNPAGIIRL